MQFAGFWRRFAAGLVDGGILTAVFLLLDKIITDMRTGDMIYQIFCLLYFVLQESWKFQATIGQRVMRLCVADVTGKRISIMRAAVRYFIWSLPLVPFIVWSMSGDFYDIIALTNTMTDAELEAFLTTGDAMRFAFMFVATFGGGTIVFFLSSGLPIALTREKTGLHDIITKTRVFYKPTGVHHG